MNGYTQDALVQQTKAEYLEKQLGWESVYAYSNGGFGSGSLLSRTYDREVALMWYLIAKLVELGSGLPQSVFARGHHCILPYFMNVEIAV